MALQLYIGNKNYSSWSMRPWVLLTQAGIAFEEVMVRFDSFEANSTFKRQMRGINPVGKVPVLVDDGFAVWDTLAIAEYLAERFPKKPCGLRPAGTRSGPQRVRRNAQRLWRAAQPLPHEH
jgi:glutathione S-transferase